MSTDFLPLAKIFSWEESSSSGYTKYTTTFVEFKLSNCTLKQDLAQFRKGTRFTFFKVNQYCVGKLNINEDGTREYGEAPGYNYSLHMRIRVGKTEYNEIFGHRGLCYQTKGTEIITKPFGLQFTDCVNYNKRHIYELSLDFTTSTLSMDKKKVPFEVQLRLEPKRSIRTKFIDTEYLNGRIDDYDYKQVAVCNSLKKRWDVRMPKSYDASIEKKLSDKTQEARRKLYKYTGPESLDRHGKVKS